MALYKSSLFHINILYIGIVQLKVFRKIGIAYNSYIYKWFFLSFP